MDEVREPSAKRLKKSLMEEEEDGEHSKKPVLNIGGRMQGRMGYCARPQK